VKLLLLGATGPTGRCVLSRALDADDEVTVLARHPQALEDVAHRIAVVPGDATVVDDVQRVMEGQDAVIATLGRGRSVRPDGLFSAAAQAVVTAAQRAGVKRLVWMSSFGVADTLRDASFLERIAYATVLRAIYADKAEGEKALRASDLDWTIVYPTTLTNGPARGTYRAQARIQMHGSPRISRADVADFLWQAARDAQWAGRSAVLTD